MRLRVYDVAFFVCVAGLWTTSAVRPPAYRVLGNAMAPAVHDGDIVVGRPATQIVRGDIIVYFQDDRYRVARVLGLPLDTIAVTNDDVRVNGRIAVENYIDDSNRTVASVEGVDSTVPIQHYFVLADRRDSGLDSRRVGPIAAERVVSRAQYIYRSTEPTLADRAAVTIGFALLSLLAGGIIVLYPFTSRTRVHRAAVTIHAVALGLALAAWLLTNRERLPIGFSLSFYYGLHTVMASLATTYAWLGACAAVTAYLYVVRGGAAWLPPRRVAPNSVSSATTEYRYWAFISYSTKDRSWARWLHRVIENYRIPSRLIDHPTPSGEPAPKRFRPLFHDRAELPASATLASPIEDALRASRYLIVICSPHAARSSWVDKEVETFHQLGRSGRAFAVIVDGEPNANDERQCFPPALRHAQPIAADARPEGDGKHDARLKLLAGMLGVGFDALKQRDSHRRLRRAQLIAASSSLLLLVFAGLAVYANRQRETAVKARIQAESILEYLVYDLRDKLAPVGRLDLARDVQDKVDAYYRDLGIDTGDAVRLRNRTAAHDNAGDRLMAEGRLADALREYRASLAVRESLAERDRANALWQGDLSTSHNKIGDVQRMQGDLTAAIGAYQRSLAITEQLVRGDPANARWQRSLLISHEQIGDVHRAQGDVAGALAAYKASLAIAKRLVESDRANVLWQRDLSRSHTKIGDIQSARGDMEAALAAYQAGLVNAEQLVKGDPTNAELQRDLSVSHNKVGDAHWARRDVTRSLAAYQASLAIAERLVRLDPTNVEWQRDLAICHEQIGDVRRAQRDPTQALAAYRAGLAIRERLAAADSSNKQSQSDLSLSYERIAIVHGVQGDLTQAAAAYRASVAIREQLAAADSSNAAWQRNLWVAYFGMAIVLEQSRDASALVWWRKASSVLTNMQQRGMHISPEDEKLMQQVKGKIALAKDTP
jgi:signal peptidase I